MVPHPPELDGSHCLLFWGRRSTVGQDICNVQIGVRFPSAPPICMKNSVSFDSFSDSSGEHTREYNITSDDVDVVSIAEVHDRTQRELDYDFQKRKSWNEIKMIAVLAAIILAIAAFMSLVC